MPGTRICMHRGFWPSIEIVKINVRLPQRLIHGEKRPWRRYRFERNYEMSRYTCRRCHYGTLTEPGTVSINNIPREFEWEWQLWLGVATSIANFQTRRYTLETQYNHLMYTWNWQLCTIDRRFKRLQWVHYLPPLIVHFTRCPKHMESLTYSMQRRCRTTRLGLPCTIHHLAQY